MGALKPYGALQDAALVETTREAHMDCERRRRRVPVTRQRSGHERRDGEDRRTEPLWFKLDVVFREDPLVDELGHECGAGGPLVWVCLIAAAKAQEKLHDRRGTVEIGWRAVARAGYFESLDEARKVIDTAVELGLLEIVEDGRFELIVYLPNYARKQAVPSMDPDAVRKREERAAARSADQDTIGEIRTDPDASGRVRERPTDREGERDRETAAAARAHDPIPTGQHATDAGLHPDLAEVVQILESAVEPNGRRLVIEPLSLNAMLLAHRDKDAVMGAHEAASMVLEGRNTTSQAGRLLGGVLGRQRVKPRVPEPPAKPWAGALRHAMEGVDVDR